MILSILILVLSKWTAHEAQAMDPLVLVREGRPASSILVADRPTDPALQGALDLQGWIRKSTGAEVPIWPESETPPKPEEALILVGDSGPVRALGLDPDAFEIEEFVIRRFPGALAVIGDDERPDGLRIQGTLLAASTFADEVLGVRFMWPGESGEVVPRRTLSIWEKGEPTTIPALTDRYVRFYSAVAEIVARALPDRFVGAYAYESYYPAPVRARLHPAVVIGIAPLPKVYQHDGLREEMRQNWLGWSQSAEQLFLRPNSLRALYNFPTVYVHRLAEDLRLFADNGLLFVDYDCLKHFWSTNGLNYYVLARLLWDPYRDVDGIIDEYCEDGFGPPARPVRRYFSRIEELTTRIAARRAFEVWRLDASVLAGHYTDGLVAELRGLLDEAGQAASGEEGILERIRFLGTGLDYVPLSRDYILAREGADRGEGRAQQEYQDLRGTRNRLHQQLGRSWALNVPLLVKIGH